jgi:integrase
VSVDKRPDGKNGKPRYRARWREADGTQRSKHFERKRDAETFLATVRVDVAKGAYIGPDAGKQTVGEYAQRWASAQPWRQSSRDRAEHIIRAQIVPTFGVMQLQAVRHSDVQAWVGRMSRTLAPSTVESYFRQFAAVMIGARRDRLIHESPCEGVRLPRADGTKSALVPLTTDQVHAIADAVPERYRALVVASAGLGLRQGEACGLTVDRVNFLRPLTVKIDRQLITPAKGECHFGPPKTPSSNRVVPMSPLVKEALAAHLARFGHGPHGLIFTSSTGAMLRRSTWQDAFERAAGKVGVDATSHDLRHYCASLLIAQGCSVTSVQHFLGHKNSSETLDTYSHLWPNDEDRIRDAIDAGLSQSEDQMRTRAISGR